ncbi:MAG: PilZ domain-containing protein [bacterium]
MHKHRLRDYFRVDVNLDFKVALISEFGVVGKTVPIVNVGTTNISGGGFFFYTSEQVQEQGLIQISLDLEENGIVVTKGKIIRCRIVNEKGPVFGVAVRFIDQSNQESEKILNFLFSTQRKQLSKGTYRESKQLI